MPPTPCTFFSAALACYARHLPHFQATLNGIRDADLEIDFGVDTDFSMPGHGQRIRQEIFENGKIISNYSMANIKYYGLRYITLALVDVSEMNDHYLACLVATWVTDEGEEPTLFISSINTSEEFTLLLFEVLERMIEFLWLTNSEDERFEPLQEADEILITIDPAALSDECAVGLMGTGFRVDPDSGMLLKGLAFIKD